MAWGIGSSFASEACTRIVQEDERPQLSGATKQHEAEFFIIHYTLQGYDATTKYYVEKLAEALEKSFDVQINQLGWRLPPFDCGEGGDTRLDVYVMDISDGAIGYAVPEQVIGDNPNTQAIELYASYTYLVIDNDMSFTDYRTAIDVMQVTAAHELHHNIQFGYDVNESYEGLYESGASWIETLVYPETAEVYDYLLDLLPTTDLCLGAMPRGYGTRIYAEWVMLDSLARDYGMNSYRDVWEYLAIAEGMEGFYTSLARLGTTSQDVMARLAVRLLLLDFAHAYRFPTTVSLEAVIDAEGDFAPPKDGVQQLGVDYVAVELKGVHTFSVDKPFIHLYFVGINGDEAWVHPLLSRGTIDTARYERGYLIVQNTKLHRTQGECRFDGWQINVTQGGGKPLAPSTGGTWNASNFVAP